MKIVHRLSLMVAGIVLAAGMVSCKTGTGGGEGPDESVPAPANLDYNLVPGGDGDVQIVWDQVVGATYEVEYDVDVVVSKNATRSSLVIPHEELEYDTQYDWRVRAVVDDRKSEWSESTFTSGKEPPKDAVDQYVGTWLASQEDVEMSAEARIPFMGMPIPVDLMSLFTQNVSDGELPILPVGDMELVFTKHPTADNKLLLSVGNLAALLPEDARSIELTVKGNNVNGTYRNNTPVSTPFDFPVPIPIVSLPGISQIASMFQDMTDANITGIELYVDKVTITGSLNETDPNKAHITIAIESTIAIKLDKDIGLDSIDLDTVPLFIGMDIDCTKEVE